MSLRLRDLITDEEYQKTKATLSQERQKLMQAQEANTNASWFEPAQLLISFKRGLVSRFTQGDSTTRRLILEIVGSNPILTDRKLMIEARKPFRIETGAVSNSSLRATLQEVRTLIETEDREMLSIIAGIRKLNSQDTPTNI